MLGGFICTFFRVVQFTVIFVRSNWDRRLLYNYTYTTKNKIPLLVVVDQAIVFLDEGNFEDADSKVDKNDPERLFEKTRVTDVYLS